LQIAFWLTRYGGEDGGEEATLLPDNNNDLMPCWEEGTVYREP
jgi:hypothetical protein